MLPLKIFEDTEVRARADRWFFFGMAVIIVVMDGYGFYRAFTKTNMLEELHSVWVRWHVLFFTSWIFIFLAQTALVAWNRVDLHRKFGIAGVVDCGLMIAITVGGAISAFVSSVPRSAFDHFMLHVVVHVDAIDFAILAIAGILYRNKDPEIHKRLMFMATVVVAARFPFIGRLFGTGWHHYVDQDAFFVVGVLYDLITRGRVNKAYIWGGLIFVLMPPAADLSFRYLVPHLMAVQPSLP